MSQAILMLPALSLPQVISMSQVLKVSRSLLMSPIDFPSPQNQVISGDPVRAPSIFCQVDPVRKHRGHANHAIQPIPQHTLHQYQSRHIH